MKRESKKLTAAREFFQRNAIEQIERVGAKRADGEGHTIETPAGTLRIHVYDDAWIAARFDDVHLGHVVTKAIGCRPDQVASWPSGKWNFHYADEPAALNHPSLPMDFVAYLELLLAYVVTDADRAEVAKLQEAQQQQRAHYQKLSERPGGILGGNRRYGE